jgi:hypothetical protein
MKALGRLVLTASAALALAGGLAATAVAQDGGQPKQSLCHIAGGGYVEIEVAQPSVAAHLAHGDVMPDEYGECPGGGPGPGQWFVSGLVQFFQFLFHWLSQGWHGFGGGQVAFR